MKLTASGGEKIFLGPHYLLPFDKARHVGEAVAMIVAETVAQAMDAAEAVEVDYEPLAFVVDAASALANGAPAIWDEVPDNTLVDTRFGDAAATDAAFAKADDPHGVSCRPRYCSADNQATASLCRSVMTLVHAVVTKSDQT
jgi:aerobic carbon-monoxide dehydrogenase large subunit